MPETPIIFSAPMVRALLDGRKTMTRRLAMQTRKTHPSNTSHDTYQLPSPWQKVQPGDRLWVRETSADMTETHGQPWEKRNPDTGLYERGRHPFIWYRADGDQPDMGDGVPGAEPWTPAIHMLRKHSRLTLVVTATKIERLQDISAHDSIAEGVECPTCTAMGKSACNRLGCFASQGAFAELWCHLHGRESWAANPEVVALSFTVHRQNIDQLKEAA